MRNSLYLTSLGLIFFSCGTQQKSSKTNNHTIPNPPKPVIAVKKPEIKEDEGEYYKVNIADITKNDNTISYGSIVGANPAGYKITKNYFPAIGQNFRQRYLILHYTVHNDEKSISTLTQQSVSAHYLVR